MMLWNCTKTRGAELSFTEATQIHSCGLKLQNNEDYMGDSQRRAFEVSLQHHRCG